VTSVVQPSHPSDHPTLNAARFFCETKKPGKRTYQPTNSDICELFLAVSEHEAENPSIHAETATLLMLGIAGHGRGALSAGFLLQAAGPVL